MGNRYVRIPRHRRASRESVASGNAARLIGFGILALALLLIAIGAAVAQEYSAKAVTVAHPSAPATPDGANASPHDASRVDRG